MIEKLLVALDGSEPADEALNCALDLAEKYSASVTLLTVVRPIVVPQVSPATVPPLAPQIKQRYERGLKEGHKKILSEALQKSNEVNPNLDISTKLLEGNPSQQIVDFAKKEDFDMIIMGSRGLGGFKELFLGSVSDRVADKAHCPVLIVK
ncbi:MAG: universal stress protein [Thermoproteota archaeon]